LKSRREEQVKGEDPWTKQRLEIEEVFNRELLGKSEAERSTWLPIFIVSMPRSGTTLTEQIISSHPQVHGCGELFAISDIAHTLSRRLGSQIEYPHCVSELSAVLHEEIVNEYLGHVLNKAVEADGFSDGSPPLRVTDKMPTNFWHLGLINVLFPDVKIIHVERDPMDVCWSCFKQNLTWPFCDLDAIATYFENYALMMAHWQRVLPQQIHSVRYEDLIGNPEEESRKLIAYCGLEWDDACLDRQSGSTAIQTPSKWQVRQPIYHSSIEAWKKYDRYLEGLAQRLQPYRDRW
jgi:hypothetical protein